MSKKHFNALAQTIRHNLPDPGSATYQAEAALFARLTKDIAGVCAASNPRFDRGRFLHACGLTELEQMRLAA
jgi:hypothetical protein